MIQEPIIVQHCNILNTIAIRIDKEYKHYRLGPYQQHDVEIYNFQCSLLCPHVGIAMSSLIVDVTWAHLTCQEYRTTQQPHQ